MTSLRMLLVLCGEPFLYSALFIEVGVSHI